MRRLLILLTTGIVFFVLISGGIIFLAETHPFLPGSMLFPLQSWAEQIQVRLSPEPADRLLDLLQRRIDDLAQVEGEEGQIAAATTLFTTLEQVLRTVAAAEPADQPRLIGRLQELLINGQTILNRLPQNVRQHPDIAALIQQINILLSTGELPIALNDDTNPITPIGPEAIPFLNEDIDHSFYPLIGGHEAVACESCHTPANTRTPPPPAKAATPPHPITSPVSARSVTSSKT